MAPCKTGQQYQNRKSDSFATSLLCFHWSSPVLPGIRISLTMWIVPLPAIKPAIGWSLLFLCHFPAFFSAFMAGFGALLTMLYFVFGALITARLTNFSA
jgi:hypothetical protein